MAANLRHTTSSPRNHLVDENEGLARKKARLSEEEKGESTDDSVIVEALPPEDIGTSLDNAIEIDDDLSMDLSSYSEEFDILVEQASPLEAIVRIDSIINANQYLDTKIFANLANALDRHVQGTANESTEWKQHYLEDEAEFFGRLAVTVIHMLDAGDIFEPQQDSDNHGLRRMFEYFMFGIEALCRRIIPLLPQAIRATLSRRDSTQTPAHQQVLPGLGYLMIATRIIIRDTPTPHVFYDRDRHGRLNNLVNNIRGRFFQDGVNSSLPSIIRALTGNMRELKDSWHALKDALSLYQEAVSLLDSGDLHPDADVEDVMDIVNVSILPAISEKHPRALPLGFHNYLIFFGAQMLQAHVTTKDNTTATDVYERFVKSDTDAVVPDSKHNDSISSALLHLCNGDRSVLARLLSSSWAIQAAHTFIRSDVMDVRNVGITSLKQQLVHLYKQEKDSPNGFDHPVVQYAVRFLRQNEITAYIFGPESRAGLVEHSGDIICFLAATSTYTDAETDIIWKACSTSVEADFVKASLEVLEHMMNFLDFQHLIYIARRYSTIAPERLDAVSVNFLEKLLRTLEEKSSVDASDNLAIVFTAIDILKVGNELNQSHPMKQRLRKTCRTPIERLRQPYTSSDVRAKVYAKCIPAIQEQSESATTAIEVLNIFLTVRLASSETDYILAMLPVTAAVDEFCDFVNSRRTEPSSDSSLFGAMIRLLCITRLMALTSTPSSKHARDRLFDFAFGESALCYEARNQAWTKLYEMASANSAPSAASSLWREYMRDHVPFIKADMVTPKLMEFICVSLKGAFSSEEVKADLKQIFQLELWKTLGRLATTSKDPQVVDLAAKVTMDLLFDYPISITLPSNSVALYQREFVRVHIESLCQDYQEIVQSSGTQDPSKLFQGIRLLSLVLEKSKASAAASLAAENDNVLDLSGIEHELNRIDFTAYIHGADSEPTKVFIRSSQSAKVSDLIHKLCERTNTLDNRVILNGKEVKPLPDRTLPDAGVEQSSVIMVRPKYTFDADIGKIFTCSSPVEMAIVDQFDSLESFLDGPQDVAEKAYFFLVNLRHSSRTRSKVCSTSATTDDLLPPDRLWRSLFSLRVLQCHLQDFARLGVTDDVFINRTVALLTSAMLDESRQFQPLLANDISITLTRFLEESARAEEASGPPLDVDPRVIASMISTMFSALGLPLHPNLLPDCGLTMRGATALHTYKAMVTACRTCPQLWEVLSNDPAFIKIHETLLLDHELALSFKVTNYISSICYDSTMAPGIPNFYWRAIIPSLTVALRGSFFAENYFRLAVEILSIDTIMQSSEVEMRRSIDMLVSELWSYRHKESTELPVTDKPIAGLIRLLSIAVTILKSFKKPMQLHGLSSRVLGQLLFPWYDDPKRNPLITAETRALAFDLFRGSFEADSDYDGSLDIACAAAARANREPGVAFPGENDWFRPPWNPSGLSNLGMTCYMNSLLQQLFFNLQFRNFILQQPLVEMSSQDALPQVQLLFANMQDCTSPVANTGALAHSLNVQVGNQEDVHTFYTTLLSRLEENLPDDSTKRALTGFFTGKSITQVKGECGHVSSRTEPFTELSVTVKNKGSLFESLNEFVQGEPLEGANKYKCMTCDAHDGGRLVNAMRRTCLEDVPDNLTFCLKRFTYESMLENESKVNDRFEFPTSIDMAFYKRTYLEDPDTPRISDEFELVGVIVHQGSLQYGHYWSYVRIPDASNADSASWICLEDNRFIRCEGGLREVQEQCFGGPRVAHGLDRSDNAYVLFYQRRSYIASAQSIDTVSGLDRFQYRCLPRVELLASQAQTIAEGNEWRQHIQSIFSDNFSSFMGWFLYRSRDALEARTTESNDGEDAEKLNKPQRFSKGEVEAKLGGLITTYTTRILLANPEAEKRLDSFMTALVSLVEASPATAGHILASFGVDKFGFNNAIRNESEKVRQRLFEGIWKCISHLREHDLAKHNEVVQQLAHSHASMVGLDLDLAFGKWDEYLKFAVKYAQLGVKETSFVLESGYLAWVLEILQLRWDTEFRKNHLTLNAWMKTNELDLSMLFDFVCNLLRTQHLDLSVDARELPTSSEHRRKTAIGWTLRTEEVDQIFRDRPIQNHRVWLLLLCGSRWCDLPARWQDYAPGKLLGVLVSSKAHIGLVEAVTDLLSNFCDYEEQKLEPLLACMLHYCFNRSNDCKTMMKAFTRTLLLWEGSEKEIIWFFDQAYSIVPTIVVECMIQWIPTYLNRKKAHVRHDTLRFIQERIFNLDPLSDDASFDATRIHTTRLLVDQICKTLRVAYQRQVGRGRCEPMITTLEQAAIYLADLHTEVIQQREKGVRLGHQLMVESDEARATLAGITQFLSEIGDWEGEVSLPTRTIDVRRSVEEETEVSEGSDADLDDLSSEAEAT